ncbi:MAG: hypothetical protein HRF48_04110 [Chloroflexota bacterium]|jgi:hypothetical protein
MIRTLAVVTLASAAGLAVSAQAADTQITDFRLPADTYSPDRHHFDPGFGPLSTRAVPGAPVTLDAQFSGTTQNIDGVVDPLTDIAVRTYTPVTQIVQISRYGVDPDGIGGVNGIQRIGIVQWHFDLTPLDSYLATNGLKLDALDMDLIVDALNDETMLLDIYLSYTNPAESISLTNISATSAEDNYNNFWLPTLNHVAGDIVNGTHKILTKDDPGDLSLNASLLSLYNQGVRQFNLIMTTPSYSANRTYEIEAGSGLSITTSPLPEPASAAVLGASGLILIATRRVKRPARG